MKTLTRLLAPALIVATLTGCSAEPMPSVTTLGYMCANSAYEWLGVAKEDRIKHLFAPYEGNEDAQLVKGNVVFLEDGKRTRLEIICVVERDGRGWKTTSAMAG